MSETIAVTTNVAELRVMRDALRFYSEAMRRVADRIGSDVADDAKRTAEDAEALEREVDAIRAANEPQP